ncbi:hypothetical protein [Proteus mirabilis]|uniref:hypothetical protein n=1 Tax=Proteus mirabilis TaxID=584 RepID=UPI0034D3DC28
MSNKLYLISTATLSLSRNPIYYMVVSAPNELLATRAAGIYIHGKPLFNQVRTLAYARDLLIIDLNKPGVKDIKVVSSGRVDRDDTPVVKKESVEMYVVVPGTVYERALIKVYIKNFNEKSVLLKDKFDNLYISNNIDTTDPTAEPVPNMAKHFTGRLTMSKNAVNVKVTRYKTMSPALYASKALLTFNDRKLINDEDAPNDDCDSIWWAERDNEKGSMDLFIRTNHMAIGSYANLAKALWSISMERDDAAEDGITVGFVHGKPIKFKQVTSASAPSLINNYLGEHGLHPNAYTGV